MSAKPTKKRASGGKRAVEAKHRERDAERPAGWAARQLRDFVRCTRGLHGLALAVATSEWAVRWAGKDPGLPPEQVREQVIRASSVLGKLSDPQKVIEKLGLDLRLAAADIEELEEKLRGSRQHKSTAIGSAPPQLPSRRLAPAGLVVAAPSASPTVGLDEKSQ